MYDANKSMDALSYYDPLYKDYTIRPRFWDRRSKYVANHLREILRSYEFSRLNLIRQEGVTWLEFPAATHTRFAASLGCWLLTDMALENIHVPSWLPGESALMRGRLERMGWLEEFRLAVLLHDVGHFPFTVTIEANDRLKEKYKQYNGGIELKHENFSIALLEGDKTLDEKRARIFNYFREYLQRACCDATLEQCDVPNVQLEEPRLISNVLSKIDADLKKKAAQDERLDEELDARLERIVYLLDPDQERQPPSVSNTDRAFLEALRQLVMGVVDLGLIDRYRRASHLIGGIGRDFPPRWLFHHLAVTETGQFMLFGDGVSQLFAMLEEFHETRERILHNPRRLAYEAILNHAINLHWDWTMEQHRDPRRRADDGFLRLLPFMDDCQLLEQLRNSGSNQCRKMIRRFLHQQPYECIGWYHLPIDTLNAMSDCSSVEVGELYDARRRYVLDKFDEFNRRQPGDRQCLFRLTKGFGSPTRTERQGGKLHDRPNWIDFDRFCVGDESISDDSMQVERQVQQPKPLREARPEAVAHYDKENARQQQSFWVFPICDLSKQDATTFKEHVDRWAASIGAERMQIDDEGM